MSWICGDGGVGWGGGVCGTVNDCPVNDHLKEFRMEAWPLPLCRNCVSKCFGAMFSGCLLNSFWIVLTRARELFLVTLCLTQAVLCFWLSLLFSCHPYFLTPLEYAGEKVSQEQETYYSNPKWNPCENSFDWLRGLITQYDREGNTCIASSTKFTHSQEVEKVIFFAILKAFVLFHWLLFPLGNSSLR